MGVAQALLAGADDSQTANVCGSTAAHGREISSGAGVAVAAPSAAADADKDANEGAMSDVEADSHSADLRRTNSWTGSDGDVLRTSSSRSSSSSSVASSSSTSTSTDVDPTSSTSDDYSSADEVPPAAVGAGDGRPDLSNLFVESLRDQTPVAMLGQMEYGSTISGRVLRWFHEMRDADRSAPVFSGDGDIADTARFDTPALKRVFSEVCTANGAGMSRNEASNLYVILRAVETAAGPDGEVGGRFPSKTAFWKAIRNEKRRTLEALGWRTVPLVIAGKTYHLLYRDALDVAQELVRQVRVDHLQWDATVPDDADSNEDHVWTGPFDSAAFFENDKDVREKMAAGTKVLGLYAYSDSTILTSSGGMFIALESHEGEACITPVRTLASFAPLRGRGTALLSSTSY